MTKFNLIAAISFSFCLRVVCSQAQDNQSSITLLTLASERDRAQLSLPHLAKVEHLEKSKTYKRVQLVKVGNLAKIQKRGILTFTLPGSTESVTFLAKTVNAMSELDFTWVGASADERSIAFFICKNGNLSGSFSVNGRSFQLGSLGEGLSGLVEDRTDLPENCDAK